MAEYIDEELKTVEVKDSKGNVIESKDFYISKFPAVLGREIMMRYSVSMANINENYESNAEILRKIMKFARVEMPDGRRKEISSMSRQTARPGKRMHGQETQQSIAVLPHIS